MFEEIADGKAGPVEKVEIRRAGETACGDEAVGIGRQGTGRRQELVGGSGLVILETAQDGERGVVPRLPCQRRGDEDAIVVDEIDLRLAAAGETGQAEEQAVALENRSTQVKPPLKPVEIAAEDLDFAERLDRRPLGDDVDEAARRTLAIENG